MVKTCVFVLIEKSFSHYSIGLNVGLCTEYQERCMCSVSETFYQRWCGIITLATRLHLRILTVKEEFSIWLHLTQCPTTSRQELHLPPCASGSFLYRPNSWEGGGGGRGRDAKEREVGSIYWGCLCTGSLAGWISKFNGKFYSLNR